MPTTQVRLPDLGEGLTEAIIVRWLVGVGDEVTEDQAVAEVETAKATVELPAPFAGTVAELHAGEGEEVAVGAPVLSLDLDGAGAAPPSPASAAGGDPDAGSFGDVRDRAAADDNSGNVLVGYGTGRDRGRRRRSRARHEPSPPRPPHEASPRATRPRAKPPVRKLAKDLGVDLSRIGGTGPDGRITRDDVHAASQGSATDAAAQPAADGRAGGIQREPVTGVRARIAEHLSVAWREIPAASCWVDVDATLLLGVRSELAAAHPDVKVTPLAIVLRCCAVALTQVPLLNASFDAQAHEIIHHDAVHLGVATQTDRGLMVPVVRDAQDLSVLELASAVQRIAARAREHSLAPAELVGSTFTVSNFGGFGIDGGGPIINHPEAGILGVGRIAPRPWVIDDAVVVRPIAQFSLSFDHRVCDGAEAARFLRLLADLVERPTLLLGH